MASAYDSYNTLLGKIDDLSQRQLEAYGELITCRAGCFDCCRPPDSLFQVEVASFQKAIRALSPEQKHLVGEQLASYEQGQRELCPLLEEGRCSVYEGRPVICRTQGFALWMRGDSEEESEKPKDFMTWCSYNFKSQEPEKDLAFDVQRLNVMLSLMTSLHWPPEDVRKELTVAIHEALQEQQENESPE